MANTKSVDSSLWWDPFDSLLTDLENASVSGDLPLPLVNKLKENHAWFVETLSMFKSPNQKSKEALDSDVIKIKEHKLVIRPELKEKALRISSYLNLDEIQSYILVERSLDQESVATDPAAQELVHMILLQYYIERQCLLKCTRCILVHALYAGIHTKEDNPIGELALKLISDGLESKLTLMLESFLTSSYPQKMDVDLFTLWAEETLIEDTLILDIMFLVYYESFCTCNGESWRKLCSLYKGILSGSYNFGKLAVSSEAQRSASHARIQLLMILIETLDLEKLLQTVHDGVPFRSSLCGFSITDIQEMDGIISSLNISEAKEAGPLMLAWAVFLCLISSLPGKEENRLLMEIDHVSYVQQAFEAESLSRFLEILQSDLLKESDGPVAGYCSVLRTFISAFIASYEINLQLENGNLKLLLEIICKIYEGEESLCIQFWDRKSFVDGPIRCLLCDLESEFPFRAAEYICLLSSLCQGSWPAQCVYNFLDKSTGISTLFDITSGSPLVDGVCQMVETSQPVHVPGLEGVMVPSKTRGRVLRMVSENIGLVRWEYALSGIAVLIVRLANAMYTGNNSEVLMTLELLRQMVTFNKAVCFSLLNINNIFHVQESYVSTEMETDVRVVDIVCNLVTSTTLDSGGAAVMAVAVDILAKLMQCSPSNVANAVLKTNVFDMTSRSNVLDIGYNVSLSGSWLLSGKLAKMILIDCEKNDTSCPLVISVLDLVMQLVEAGLENDVVLALVVFSLQYILVSHEYWKSKKGNVRWKVTLKAIEVMKTCIRQSLYFKRLCDIVRDILLNDTSVHGVLFRIVCTTTHTLEKLCVSRFIEASDIEGWQLAIASVLDVFDIILSRFSENTKAGHPMFHQALLSSPTKPVPVVAAITSLISYFRNPIIQVSSAKVLSRLFTMAESSQLYLISNACFGLDDKQITDFKNSVSRILLNLSGQNEDLFVSTMKLLTTAARYQPAFLVAVIASKDESDVQTANAGNPALPGKETPSGPESACKSCILDIILQYVERADDFINSNPGILLSLLEFLKALWQEAGQYANTLDPLKSSEKMWKQLLNLVSQTAELQYLSAGHLANEEIPILAQKYECLASVLDIMACYMFLNKKLLYAESLVKPSLEPKDKTGSVIKSTIVSDPKAIFSKWCDGSVLSSLIQAVSSLGGETDIDFNTQVAASLLTVHLIGKLETSGSGALSVSLVGKIKHLSEMLYKQPAYSELMAQYSNLGYSEGKELKTLILGDLYCHLQGKLEGREIPTGPFKEVFQFLVSSSFWDCYKQKINKDVVDLTYKDKHLFDIRHIKTDLGIDTWDFSEWSASKTIAEDMLHYMEKANSIVLLSSSRLSALEALISVVVLYEDNSLEETKVGERKLPYKVTVSSTNELCKNLRASIESLSSSWEAPKEIFDVLAAQMDLLSCLLKSAKDNLSLSSCALVLRNVGSGLKVLGNLKHSNAVVKKALKLLLESLLLVVAFGSNSNGTRDTDPVKDLTEISDAALGLLPLLCNFMPIPEYSTLCLTSIDLILRSFLTPETWFPIIQNHLHLQQVILQLQDKNSTTSVPAILKFLLTIAQVHSGAEMLLNSGFFSTLRALFIDLVDGRSGLVNSNEKGTVVEKREKPPHIWGLGLAVVTAMVQSLGGGSVRADVVESVISYFFSDQAHMILYYLTAPDFPSDNHDKKRARMQRTWTSLAYLRETEHTLVLMCALASHWRSWVKIMKEINIPLRETCIHLLAYISKGGQCMRESRTPTTHFLCPPIHKEEFESCRRPSLINSKYGWFSLAPLACNRKSKGSISTALVVTGRTIEAPEAIPGSDFSDSVAVQIYRVTGLLLRFLCVQVEGAVKRSEEVGFVDLAHFPELPELEILHGVQDQAIEIVREQCEKRGKEVADEVKKLCLLLVQTAEMALYLELCVVQVCRTRPVLGRVDNLSKEMKKLMKAVEAHEYLEAAMESLKQITLFVYPGLF